MRLHAGRAISFSVLIASMILGACSQPEPNRPLNTGRILTPATQTSWDVGNMPMNLVLSPDGRYAIVTDMGYRESLWSIRVASGRGVSHIDFNYRKPTKKRVAAAVKPGVEEESPPTAPGSAQSNGLYYGLVVAPGNTVYAAQGAHDSIAILNLGADGVLTQTGSMKTKTADFPAGLAMDSRGLLYVANNASGGSDPTQMAGTVAIYDPRAKAEVGRCVLTDSYGGTSNFPYGIAVLSSGEKAFVAAERDDAVYAIDTRDPARAKVLAKISAGSHPTTLLFSPDQSRLYVANSLSDTLSVIDVATDRVVHTILLRPDMARDLPGTTPTAMAFSADAKTLYVALGDMNAVGVIDVAMLQLQGYVPVGWYPSALAVIGENRLLVANAKGTTTRNPDNMPDPFDPKRKNENILNVVRGNVCTVQVPRGDKLARATEQVIDNNHLAALSHPRENPLAGIGLAAGKITHVFYIIKENRTYDQILGDVPEGNGDLSLCLFGKDITPNQHAMAHRFVLLDNLYACGEVSGDGWVWSTQGMADAYVIRNIPYYYSFRGRKYDFEGQNNGYITGGFPATGPDGKPLTKLPEFKNGAQRIPDVANTGRNIWDIAREAGIPMRNYGFFLSFSDQVGLKGGPDNYPCAPGLQPPGHDLDGITDADYRRFDLDYADSDAPATFAAQSGNRAMLFKTATYGEHQAPSRFNEWDREFQMMLAKSPDGSAVPALSLIRLPDDHTSGAKSGKHTPRAYVADNDYALGEIVQAISHSSIWRSSAIFVIEDDAQSGADHVDAHRTTGFIISPWIKARSVDHRFCNTDSFLKTMELVLGLRPMSQYDAVADPILDWNDSPANATPFDAVAPPEAFYAELNPKASELSLGDPRRTMAINSDKMDFVHPDAAPALQLDEIVWKTVKGPDSAMPIVRRTLPLGAQPNKGGDDDDDD